MPPIGGIMALSDTAIRNAKPAAKPYRLFDGGGLYLEVSPSGGKLWRLKYRFDGKEKRLALGKYPEISLKDVRDRRDPTVVYLKSLAWERFKNLEAGLMSNGVERPKS
jgi:hypothetical protein